MAIVVFSKLLLCPFLWVLVHTLHHTAQHFGATRAWHHSLAARGGIHLVVHADLFWILGLLLLWLLTVVIVVTVVMMLLLLLLLIDPENAHN